MVQYRSVLDSDLWGDGIVPNGSDGNIGAARADAIWQAIGRVDDRIRKIESQGCGLRGVQDRSMDDAWQAIKDERNAREKLKDDLEKKMDKIRNQILFGILVMTAAAVLIQIFAK